MRADHRLPPPAVILFVISAQKDSFAAFRPASQGDDRVFIVLKMRVYCKWMAECGNWKLESDFRGSSGHDVTMLLPPAASARFCHQSRAFLSTAMSLQRHLIILLFSAAKSRDFLDCIRDHDGFDCGASEIHALRITSAVPVSVDRPVASVKLHLHRRPSEKQRFRAARCVF